MKLFVFPIFLFNCWLINKISSLILNENNVKIENYVVLSTLISNSLQHETNRTRRNVDSCMDLKLILNNNLIRLCLIQRKDIYDDISKNCSVIIQMENNVKMYNLEELNITHTIGYVVDKPYSSSIVGYIEKHRFFGKINLEYRCYYVEKINKFPTLLEKYHLNESSEDAVIYERSFLYDEKEFKTRKFSPYEKEIFYNQPKFDRVKSISPIKNKLCTLLVVIDNSFLRILTRNNVRESISIVLHNIQESNSLFRSTDFDSDGTPDNIGFIVKYIVIIEFEKSLIYQLPKYSKISLDGNLYLRQFSRFRMLKNVCLGVAFTGQTFKQNVIGLSYTPIIRNGILRYPGGICEKQAIFGDYQNCLVITYRSEPKGEILPQIITELSLSHELGHSFGADHDVKECHGYIMTSTTFQKLTYKNFLFSKCSKETISSMLNHKSFCMVNTHKPFCGNGILEVGEECDCGFAMYCLQYDMCCLPRGTQRACTLNKFAGYECHPSQGLCCTSKCRYRDLTRLGINCNNFNQKTNCPPGKDKKCELKPKCMTKSCENNECTRIGLRECICPREGNTFCGTCCLNHKKQCLPVINVTRLLLYENKTLFHELSAQSKNKNNGDFNTDKNKFLANMCIKSDCFSLSFRTYKMMDFCLFNDTVGTCNEHNQCLIQGRRQIYPHIRLLNHANQNILQIYSILIFILIFFI